MAQDVDLSGCQLVTDLGIRALTSSCRNLESVNVSSCYELSDAAFESLGTCSGLRSLDACGCEQLTDAGLQALAQGARYASVAPCLLYATYVSSQDIRQQRQNLQYCSRHCKEAQLYSVFCFLILWRALPQILSWILHERKF